MEPLTHAAGTAELEWIAPAATAAGLVAGLEELAELSAEAPWRVRATDRGEAALLSRWREHLPYMAVLGLWCSTGRVTPLTRELLRVAVEQGFERLVGPMVPESAVLPYLDAGLHRRARILVMRLDRPRRVKVREAPPGVAIRTATSDDMPALLAADRASFEDFWRSDAPTMTRYARSGRMTVATEDAAIIGYTLATVRAGEGSLGRLAVVPGARGRGIGRALACESVRWMSGAGARAVTLSTQDENMVSRRLYASLGFREQPEALALTMSEPLPL